MKLTPYPPHFFDPPPLFRRQKAIKYKTANNLWGSLLLRLLKKKNMCFLWWLTRRAVRDKINHQPQGGKAGSYGLSTIWNSETGSLRSASLTIQTIFHDNTIEYESRQVFGIAFRYSAFRNKTGLDFEIGIFKGMIYMIRYDMIYGIIYDIIYGKRYYMIKCMIIVWYSVTFSSSQLDILVAKRIIKNFI